MLQISVSGLEQIGRIQAFLKPELLEKAQRAGVSYAAKAVPSAVAKSIAGRYNISSARIKQDIYPPRITPDGSEAVIRFNRQRPPTLTQYRPNPGKRGGPQPGLGRGLGWGKPKPPGRPLSVQVIKGLRTPVKGAFLAAGNSGNLLVLRERQDGRLEALYGPSIGSIYGGRSRYGAEIRAEVQRTIEQRFATGVQRALSAAERGYG